MLAIKGIYDGKKIVPLEKFTLRKKYKVVITFVEELDDEEKRPTKKACGSCGRSPRTARCPGKCAKKR